MRGNMARKSSALLVFFGIQSEERFIGKRNQ
jgi:hypothetical protein